MNVSLADVLLLFLFFVLVWHLWHAQGIKQQALLAVREYCEQMDVQLLDDGIVLRGFWLKRNPRGQLQIWRSYLFEFSSTGDERYQGRIMLLGSVVESIELQPHRLH
jgi:hypothetical protein